MKAFTNLLTSIILGIGVVVLSILSVQNATPVGLKFLTFQSIQIPVGVVLGFSVGVGLIMGAIAPILWKISNSQADNFSSNEDEEEI